MFMRLEDQPRKTLTTLVVKERRTKMVMATAVPLKSTGRFVVERVGAFIKELGIDHLDILAKSDPEPSIKKVVEDVGKHRGGGSGRRIAELSCKAFGFERRCRAMYSVSSRSSQGTERCTRSQDW